MPTEDVFDLGEHLRDGAWRVDSASLPDLRGVAGVSIVGEPDALAAAQLVLSSAGDLAKPVTIGEPPAADALVLCLSYDGESGLDALEAATGPVVAATTGGTLAARARAGGQRVVPIPAGFTPASAIGYWVSITADLLERSGAATGLRAQVEAAADAVEVLATRFTGEPEQLIAALSTARALLLGSGAAGASAIIAGESALQRALSTVLLVDVVIYHLGSLAVAGP